MNTFFVVPVLSLAFLGSTFTFHSFRFPQPAPVQQPTSTETVTNPSATYTYHYKKTAARPTPTQNTTSAQPAPAPSPAVTVTSSTESSSAAAPTQPSPANTPAVDFESALETAIHEKINAERVQNGLSPLSVDTRLATIARAHSEDMLTNNYFDHTNQNGCSASCRYKNAGYAYRAMAENIYMMSGYTLTAEQAAEKIVQGWMNSSGHRKNILNGSYTVEGIGVAVEGKKIYATENFALPR